MLGLLEGGQPGGLAGPSAGSYPSSSETPGFPTDGPAPGAVRATAARLSGRTTRVGTPPAAGRLHHSGPRHPVTTMDPDLADRHQPTDLIQSRRSGCSDPAVGRNAEIFLLVSLTAQRAEAELMLQANERLKVSKT